jgi:hypothetical protein
VADTEQLITRTSDDPKRTKPQSDGNLFRPVILVGCDLWLWSVWGSWFFAILHFRLIGLAGLLHKYAGMHNMQLCFVANLIGAQSQ